MIKGKGGKNSKDGKKKQSPRDRTGTVYVYNPALHLRRARVVFAQVHYLGYHTLSGGESMRMKLAKTERQILTLFSKGCARRR